MDQQRRHKKGYKNVQNGPIDSVPKDFIPNGQNPDNNAFFDWESNPLSSKGNSVLGEETDLYNPKPDKHS
ncbi:hypothetical protein [[Clostridium] polysaccharolyticum]|uniref:Uncharacterized protein n=1 Tax=[Clostridium] polysaccharolyticum TaxID=29364 RepID=A0A1I0C7K8_9FIRM|nr:hypothetical protein [[Clostridium] polysaccharolyticum]SET15445.1 hypothetical protein SAMN04487772_10966 [[Clostridium] polysaccharolyticum]